MIQEGDRVDVLGGGVVMAVYGPANKRMASVRTDRGDYVEVECAKCTVLPPAFTVGDHVRFCDEDGVVARIECKGHGWDVWIDMNDRTVVTSSHHAIVAHPNPIRRFAALIADAETCVLDGAATEQAKCIAALAKALRESQASLDEAKRTLRSIVELAR